MNRSEFAALPASWRKSLRRCSLTRVTTGMGGAGLWHVAPDGGEGAQYLKLASGAAARDLREEVLRTAWLGAQGISVPRILDRWFGEDVAAVRMSAVPGTPADQTDAVRHVARIAAAFRRLHRLPAEQCPFDETPKIRLARARAMVEAGAIDPENFAARNRALAPAELYARLAREARFDQDDAVVVHGDAWLSNILIGEDGAVAFVDCGRCGRSDRYTDLGVLVESFTEVFGEAAAQAFLRAYGLPAPDPRKLQFFRDLYELF
jgi:aminoglycoside 3'-phosphotransferase II